MSRTGSRGWMVLCLLGIAAWIGITVAVAVINDDPSDGRPVVLAFAGGAAAFFGAIFGYALWQTRPRSDPELDALLSELTLAPGAPSRSASAISSMRQVARAYILLGAVVTALGLAAILQEAYEIGDPRITVFALVAIVVVWALAVPLVLRAANRASRAVLTPLGLSQDRGASALHGERHGRRVRIEIGAAGSVTRLSAPGLGPAPDLAGGEILAQAGRGDESAWEDVRVEPGAGEIVVRRRGHEGSAWLWDLWLAERLAGA